MQNLAMRKIMPEKVIIHPSSNLVSDVCECLEAVEFTPKYNEVVLKPNAVTTYKSGSGHVTDLRLVDALIQVLRETYHTGKIFIMEGSSVFLNDSMSILKAVGYEQLVRKYSNLELVDVYETPLEPAEAGRFRLPSLLKERTLINLPVLKGHAQAGLTCAVKNLKGLLQKVDKKRFHQTGLHENLATLPEIPSELTLVDAITGQTCEGELFSKKVKFNLLVCGRNPVAVDIVCAKLVGLDIDTIPYLKALVTQTQLLAPGALEIVGDARRRVIWAPFKQKFSHGKIDVYVGEACSGCITGELAAIATSRHKNNIIRGVVLNVLRSLFKRRRTAYIMGKNALLPSGNYSSVDMMGECACKQFPGMNGIYYHGCPPTAEDIWREQENQKLKKN
jgi:uncharacterized protein (DUF362 family)